MALIVLSLVIIPVGGVPAAKAAAKPAQAKLPKSIRLHTWDNTLCFGWVRIPKRATSVQVYLRTTGKYVRTVKKNSYKYKKYKKNKAKYILVKKNKKYYKVYKAGKWHKFATISDNYSADENPLKYYKIYQLRFRGKNGNKVGKFSKMLQFRTLSKKVVAKAYARYSKEKQEAEDFVAYCEEHLNDPDGPDNWDPDDDYYVPRWKMLWLAQDDSAYVDHEYSLDLFTHQDLIVWHTSPEEGNDFEYEEGVGKVI